MKKNIFYRIATFLSIASILFQTSIPLLSVLSPVVFAQEVTPTETVVPVIEPTATPTVTPILDLAAEPTVIPAVETTVMPTLEPTATPTAEPTVIPTVEPTTIPTVTTTPTSEPTTTPTVNTSPKGEILDGISTQFTPTTTATPTIAEPTIIETPEIVGNSYTDPSVPTVWKTLYSQSIVEKVELNKEYVAPQNSGVKLTFTKLPLLAGNIKIEEITLTKEQIEKTGSLTNKAYDITSDMANGSFTYNLSLPIPEASKGKTVEVKFAEELSSIGSAAKVENTLTKTDTSVSINSLDHFTIFVVARTIESTTVLVSNLLPDWGTEVFSAYVGPTAYGYVSPGTTTIFNGREAGIIKAGINAKSDGHYDDEGLFGFKPTITINDFATMPLTYDVANETGISPVWMTIEVGSEAGRGTAANTTYQFVPTTNPSGWHTVNAATGLWQKWNNGNGDTTGNPLISLTEVVNNNIGKNVVRAYLRLGQGDSYYNGGTGTTAWVDKATIGGVTYDFVTNGTCIGASIALPEGTTACYSTIQAAVNAAAPDETINVAAGIYNESLNITKSVILQSTGGRDVTTIKSLTIATSSVTVSGFTIEGVNANGVASTNIFLKSGVSNITVSNNKINKIYIGSGNGDNGVGLLTTSDLVNIGDNLNVTGNIFQALDTGSNRAFYINPGIDHFTFSGNTIIGNFAYTATTQAKNGLVENNTITGAGAVGSRSAGFRALGEPDPTVWGHTTFSGNTVSGVTRGITVDEANNVTITGNTLSGNEIGVRVVAYSSLPFDITTISIHNNNLSGEDTIGYGVTNNEIVTTTNVDATNNWWGSATGPGDVGPGTGDKVSTSVNFTPWCTNDTCTTFSSDPTTIAATIVTSTTATVNGTNGASVGDDTSFWLGTTSAGPFTVSTNPASELPGGWSGVDSLTQPANAVFSHAYSGLTPGTTYHFVAWSLVDGTWYPGAVLSFTTARIYTQADFTAFDGVNIGTNSYTLSSDITATYTGSNTIKLTGYAPIVTPWFGQNWTTYNYVTVGIKLPAGFTGTTVYSTGVIRYDRNPGNYEMGTGSTPLATAGAAKGYLDYSFAANSPNTKKEGLVKLQVIWNVGDTPEYFTIDINDLSLTDTTAPTVPVLTSPINGVFIKNNAPLMQWDDSTDIGGSGIAGYEYQVYYNCTNPDNIPSSCSSVTNVNSLSSSEYQAGSTGDGVYYWQIRAKDNAGNFSGWSGLEKVTIDTTSPNFTITRPTAAQVINNRIITINGTATDTNFNYYYCYVSNVNGHEYGVRDASCTTTWHAVTPASVLGSVTLPNDLAGGNYVVHLIGYDKAGNSAEATKQFVLDNTAPIININTFITNDSTPKLTGTVNDNSALIKVEVGGNTYNPINNSGFWQIDSLSALTDGTYNVIARATDAADNIGVDSTINELTVDTVAPTATHKYYRNGAEVSGLVYAQNVNELTFNSTVTDKNPSSGLKYETFSIFQANTNGSFGWNKAYCSFRQSANTYALTGTTDTITNKELADCTSTLPDGEYYVMHGEYDNAARGNDTSVTQYSDSLGLHFVIDNTAPVIPTATPVAGSYTSDQTVTLASSDLGSGLNSIYYTIDGVTTPDKTSTLYIAPIAVDKDMTIKAIAYDNAGNASSILSATYSLPLKISPLLAASNSNNGEGGGSLSPASTPTCNDTKPGSAPTLISAVSNSLNSITLTWSKANGPVSYYLVTFGNKPGEQLYGNPNVGGADTTSYRINNLSGGIYYFKVRAGNGCAPGEYSNELSGSATGGFVAGVPGGFESGVLGAQTQITPTVTPITIPSNSNPANSSSMNFFQRIWSFILKLFGK